MTFCSLSPTTHVPRVFSLPFLLAASFGILVIGEPGFAEDAQKAGSAATEKTDVVLARVNDVEIRLSDLFAVDQEIGSNLGNLPELARRRLLVEYLIDNHLFAKQALAEKLDHGPKFERRMQYLRSRALREAYFDHAIQSQISETLVRVLYDERAKASDKDFEVKARHILVASQELAVLARKRLAEGADFATLAGEVSIDNTTKGRGGDLGYFGRGRMVADVERAAFALADGEISKPVKSRFGWHIIKVEARRKIPVPPFEKVRGDIRRGLLQEKAHGVGQSLRKEAQIEYVEPQLKRFVEQVAKKAAKRREGVAPGVKMKQQAEQK